MIVKMTPARTKKMIDADAIANKVFFSLINLTQSIKDIEYRRIVFGYPLVGQAKNLPREVGVHKAYVQWPDHL